MEAENKEIVQEEGANSKENQEEEGANSKESQEEEDIDDNVNILGGSAAVRDISSYLNNDESDSASEYNNSEGVQGGEGDEDEDDAEREEEGFTEGEDGYDSLQYAPLDEDDDFGEFIACPESKQEEVEEEEEEPVLEAEPEEKRLPMIAPLSEDKIRTIKAAMSSFTLKPPAGSAAVRMADRLVAARVRIGDEISPHEKS